MINKEVFVKEIEQTYTILKQNLILIKYVEDLISQGNTLEEAVAKIDIPIYDSNEVLTQDKLNKIGNSGMYMVSFKDNTSNINTLNIYYVIDSQTKVNSNDINYYESMSMLWDELAYDVQEVNVDNIGQTFSTITAGSTDYHLVGIDQFSELETTVNNINTQLPNHIGVKNYNGSQALILKHNTLEIPGQTNPVIFKSIFGNQSIIGSGSIDLYTHTLTLTGKQTQESENTTSFYFTKDSSVSSPINDVTQLLQLFKSSKLDVPFFALGTESNLQVWAILFKSQGVFKIRASNGTEYFITAVEDAVETL